MPSVLQKPFAGVWAPWGDFKNDDRQRAGRMAFLGGIRAMYRYVQGLSGFDSGEFDKAIRNFTQCLKLDPSHKGAGIHALLGRSYLAKGNREMAGSHLLRAFKYWEAAKKDSRPTGLTPEAESEFLRSLVYVLTEMNDVLGVQHVTDVMSNLGLSVQVTDKPPCK